MDFERIIMDFLLFLLLFAGFGSLLFLAITFFFDHNERGFPMGQLIIALGIGLAAALVFGCAGPSPQFQEARARCLRDLVFVPHLQRLQKHEDAWVRAMRRCVREKIAFDRELGKEVR